MTHGDWMLARTGRVWTIRWTRRCFDCSVGIAVRSHRRGFRIKCTNEWGASRVQSTGIKRSPSGSSISIDLRARGSSGFGNTVSPSGLGSGFALGRGRPAVSVEASGRTAVSGMDPLRPIRSGRSPQFPPLSVQTLSEPRMAQESACLMWGPIGG